MVQPDILDSVGVYTQLVEHSMVGRLADMVVVDTVAWLVQLQM